MHIVFLEEAASDLQWFHRYYRSVFPHENKKAQAHFRSMLLTLEANPYSGKPIDGHPSTRELQIPRTPFLIVYRVTSGRIEILRIWDSRQGFAF